MFTFLTAQGKSSCSHWIPRKSTILLLGSSPMHPVFMLINLLRYLVLQNNREEILFSALCGKQKVSPCISFHAVRNTSHAKPSRIPWGLWNFRDFLIMLHMLIWTGPWWASRAASFHMENSCLNSEWRCCSYSAYLMTKLRMQRVYSWMLIV